MSEEIIIEEETTVVTENNVIVGGTRKVVVTAVGLGAVAQEKTGQLFTKLIEQGETRQTKRQKQREELAKRRAETNQRVSAEIDKRVGKWLNKLNLPSKADIDELTTRINDMTERLETLKAQAEVATTTEIEASSNQEENSSTE